MSLSPGTRLGPYEIQSAIGVGGMGEVYKAKDTRLDRSVAIKVLPREVSADPDRRARFEREAKTIAGLSHPHICTLHDVGEQDGATYLVMEHLTGETLAQRLEKGPLPIEQALTVATEIADALSAAHRQGVIHRDLKPGNVMLTKAGAKLLDFGLAKLKGYGERPAAESLASAPTRTAPLTSEGTIVGTLQYMAPEQVEGKPADVRTDLWALGAILYEMLTGKRAFEGTSAASLIGAILERDAAPLSALQPLMPPALDRLVRDCLAKSMDDRPDTAHDVTAALRWVRETSVAAAAGASVGRRRRLRRTVIWPLAALLTGAVGGAGAMWLLRPFTPLVSVARPSLDVRPADALEAGGAYGPTSSTPGGSRTAFAWTPDAEALVFVGRRGGTRQLYLRRLDGTEARLLPNTEAAQGPAVSGDGRWVAFWAARSGDPTRRGSIRRVPLGGGPVMELASGVASPIGLAWSDDGRLFFGRDDGRIWVIAPDGTIAPVTSPGDGERAHTLPWLLPGGKVLLYTVRKRVVSWGDEAVIAQTLATGQRKVLLRDAVDVRYVPSGHLLFLRRGVLHAMPFDAERVEPRGSAVAVLEPVAHALTGNTLPDITGAGQFAVSADGMFAWVPSPVVPHQDAVLVTVDRRGEVARLPAQLRSYAGAVRVSPDGRQVLVVTNSLTERGLWVYDLSRGTLTPLMLDGEVFGSCWSPNGRRIAFGWLKDGRRSLAMQATDGSAPPTVMVAGEFTPSAFAADGRHLTASRGLADIVMLTVEDGQARVDPLVATPSREDSAQLSPDGRWLVYMSAESGRQEIYVQPYPGPGAKRPVSIEGGRNPAWNPNGRELFFLTPLKDGRSRMMAVDFAGGNAGDGPRVGLPRTLFEFAHGELGFACEPTRCYDVAPPDGQRFYCLQSVPAPPLPPVTHVNLILNWFEELKAKVPRQ